MNHALYLAEESGPEWVGRVFSLYRRGNLRVPIDVLARLEAIVIQRGLPEVGPLDAYLVWARSTIDPKDVRGVALLRQLERVRRLVGE